MTNIYQPGTRGNAERESAAALVTETDPVDSLIVGLLVSAHEGAIQKALEDFYSELDTIACSEPDAALPGVIEGREWLDAIDQVIGDPMEGYREWMQETWEPLADLGEVDHG